MKKEVRLLKISQGYKYAIVYKLNIGQWVEYHKQIKSVTDFFNNNKMHMVGNSPEEWKIRSMIVRRLSDNRIIKRKSLV